VHRCALAQFAKGIALILLAVLTLVSVLAWSAVRVAGVEGKVQQPSTLKSPTVNTSQLSIQGKAVYDTRQFDAAARVWQPIADTYTLISDKDGITESLINKAESLQALGLYPRACNTLLQAFRIAESDCQQLIQENENRKQRQDSFIKTLEEKPNSRTKAVALRGLGDVLQKLGDLDLSKRVLQLSLDVARGLPSPQHESAALLSLGNTERAKGNRERDRHDATSVQKLAPLRCINRHSLVADKSYQQAAELYQQAATISPSALTKVQAQLNQLSVLLETKQPATALAFWTQIPPKIAELPVTQASVAAQINLAKSLICMINLKQATVPNVPSWQDIDRILIASIQQAQSLGNQRLLAYALGYRGGLYEQIEPLSFERNPSLARAATQQAITLTQQALMLSQAIQAWDIAYLWQWQLGHLLKTQGDIKGAIAAYAEAFNILEFLRGDLVALNSDIQFSFRESVEPVYRQLVELLLQPELSQDDVKRVVLNPRSIESQKPDSETQNSTKPQQPLELAREVIESLQVAELENFLRCSLQDAKPVPIDQPTVDPTAAIIYPIILSDRIDVILSLPGKKPLKHYSDPLPKDEKIAGILGILRKTLQVTKNTNPDPPPKAQQMYDLLLRKMEADLQNNNIKTLVFVLDGRLRDVPMAALHDGKQYLIEKYAVALSPSLQLLAPKPLARERLEALAAGFSKASPGLPALTNVPKELEQIKSVLPSVQLLNEEFTTKALKKNINSRPFPIVHLATHGKFGSQVEDTYILTGDGDRININQLSNLLQTREQIRPEAIELLTLSACETAQGDKRAALGMAGVAIRSGARSTLATLWSVNDQSTTDIMSQFYELLVKNSKITKAKALQSAQVELLRKGKSPFHWSPYVLIGNWL
jgi:CHAT domain-containing protein